MSFKHSTSSPVPLGRKYVIAQLGVFLGFGFGCEVGSDSPWNDPEFRETASAVIAKYGVVVAVGYDDTLLATEVLEGSVASFLAAPGEATMAEARAAWLSARALYSETEVFRFYEGPIDGVEGRINAWPLDEAYIDYVVGEQDAGIISNPDAYPTIDVATVLAANEALGEDTISSGWHALEFLLWGQDLDPEGPGDRPYSDYIDGPEATAAHADRRRQYIRAVMQALLADLRAVDSEWHESQGLYRRAFVGGDPKEAVRRMLLGMASLGGDELAGERITVAFETREQEDEHSCFSDNTHNDLIAGARGIENVYLGRVRGSTGPGISALVAKLDADLDRRLRVQLERTALVLESIPAPFDRSIQAAEGSPAREAIAASIEALRVQTEMILEVAELLEVELNIEA